MLSSVTSNEISYLQLSSVISNKISNWRLDDSKPILRYCSLSVPPENLRKHLVLMYFRKYWKRKVPWNGLKIFFSAECWHSCLLHNKHVFLLSVCTGSSNVSICTGSISVLERHKGEVYTMLSDLIWFQGIPLSDCLQ